MELLERIPVPWAQDRRLQLEFPSELAVPGERCRKDCAKAALISLAFQNIGANKVPINALAVQPSPTPITAFKNIS